MARAMASPLRVKNTAYFDIAASPLPPARPCGSLCRRWLEAIRPGRDGQAQQGQAAAMPARERHGWASTQASRVRMVRSARSRVGQASPGRPRSTSDGRAQQPLREGAGQSDDTERRARSVPAQWKEEFTVASAAFFTEGEEPLGSRAGRPTSALVRDVAFVANYQVPDS